MQLSDISTKFTQDTLDEIIRKKGGKKYTGWEFGVGFKKGDSYLSNAFRLTVKGEDENGESVEVKLVVKGLPKNEARKKLFRIPVFFRNEINFYTKVLPVFEKFQKERNAKNPFIEYPICYATYSDGVNDFVALEDIGVDGYGAPSRLGTIDEEHGCLIMKGLGRFHGVSLAFKELQPEEFAKLTQHLEETYYAEEFRKGYEPFLKVAIAVAEDAVTKEFPGTEYETKTKKFLQTDLYKTQIDLVNRQNKYSVIQHGDCWMPNFLMRYENNTPIDMKIIDYQLARYASPAVDLSFFLYSCTDNEMRSKHYDSLLKAYHEGATDLIRDLGVDPEKVYPYSALLAEMKEVAKFGCGMGIESLPLSMKEDDEIADLDALTDMNAILTDVWKISPLPDKSSRLRIAEAFKHAIDMGYID